MERTEQIEIEKLKAILREDNLVYVMRILEMAKNYEMNVNRATVLSEVYEIREDDVSMSIQNGGYFAEKLRKLEGGLFNLWCELDNRNRRNLVKAILDRYADVDMGYSEKRFLSQAYLGGE
tara:strand:+ start:317 stop:679 length:363 start_codon:yes stop_codon:yes gene_type:complete